MDTVNAAISPRAQQCKLLNESICEFTQSATSKGDAFVVSVYNPLARSRSINLRIPIENEGYAVFHEQDPLPSQVGASFKYVHGHTRSVNSLFWVWEKKIACEDLQSVSVIHCLHSRWW